MKSDYNLYMLSLLDNIICYLRDNSEVEIINKAKWH